MKRRYRLLAMLALLLTVAGLSGYTTPATDDGGTTLQTPSGDTLSLGDSVNVDSTTVISVENFPAWRLEVEATLDSCTRVDWYVQVTTDNGNSWTTLTQSLDADLDTVSVGSAGTVRNGEDSTTVFYLVRPGVFADSLGWAFAQARELLFATDVRVYWSKTVGIDIPDSVNSDPQLDVAYKRWKRAGLGLE